ncbi:hypothetical protein PITC_050470 [Penicillium italicum]|uniref:Myb-like DNA-binding domain-containing protein n=1 Tax=Penicillium italicum TaxID=40296 RepID=A0A0A2L683_PENIT|nr:hypothetical protein PITC_050470 [Penicillium italicum]
MAKEQVTPKKATKPVKAGIVKRTPVKAFPANASSIAAEKDAMFLWKCIKLSSAVKINWAAVAQDAGKSVGTVQKQWSRLNIKMAKIAATSDPEEDAEEDADGDADENADLNADQNADEDVDEEGDLVAASNDSV